MRIRVTFTYDFRREIEEAVISGQVSQTGDFQKLWHIMGNYLQMEKEIAGLNVL